MAGLVGGTVGLDRVVCIQAEVDFADSPAVGTPVCMDWSCVVVGGNGGTAVVDKLAEGKNTEGKVVVGVAAVGGKAVVGVAAVEGRAVVGVAAVEGKAVVGVAAVEGRGVVGVAAVEGKAVVGVAAVEGTGVVGVVAVEGKVVVGVVAVAGTGAESKPGKDKAGGHVIAVAAVGLFDGMVGVLQKGVLAH